MIILTMTFTAAAFDIPYCKNTSQIEQNNCLVSIDDIRPTQFLIGMLPIKSKIKKIEKKYKRNKLTKKMITKLIPTVIGPDNKHYILDGHHSSYALYKSNIPQQNKLIYVDVIKDCSKCSFHEFSKIMTNPGKSYLYSEDYNSIDFFELPRSLDELTDCPYRSLSWKLREMGCYKKVNINFLEFVWAKVIKEDLENNGIFLKDSNKKELKRISLEYCEKLKHPKYSNLPGYLAPH